MDKVLKFICLDDVKRIYSCQVFEEEITDSWNLPETCKDITCGVVIVGSNHYGRVWQGSLPNVDEKCKLSLLIRLTAGRITFASDGNIQTIYLKTESEMVELKEVESDSFLYNLIGIKFRPTIELNLAMPLKEPIQIPMEIGDYLHISDIGGIVKMNTTGENHLFTVPTSSTPTEYCRPSVVSEYIENELISARHTKDKSETILLRSNILMQESDLYDQLENIKNEIFHFQFERKLTSSNESVLFGQLQYIDNKINQLNEIQTGLRKLQLELSQLISNSVSC